LPLRRGAMRTNLTAVCQMWQLNSFISDCREHHGDGIPGARFEYIAVICAVESHYNEDILSKFSSEIYFAYFIARNLLRWFSNKNVAI
jgi:hypothetical protein